MDETTVTKRCKCVVCELTFEREELLSHSYAEGAEDGDHVLTLCVEHQKGVDEGYIYLIEIEVPEKDTIQDHTFEPKRTGRTAKIKESLFTKMYPNSEPQDGLFLVLPHSFDNIIRLKHTLESKYGEKNRTLH